MTIGWCGLAFLMGPTAILLGALALRRNDHTPTPISNRGSAIAGIITGLLGTLAVIVFFALSITLDTSST